MRQVRADDQHGARKQPDSHPTYPRCVDLRVVPHVGPHQNSVNPEFSLWTMTLRVHNATSRDTQVSKTFEGLLQTQNIPGNAVPKLTNETNSVTPTVSQLVMEMEAASVSGSVTSRFQVVHSVRIPPSAVSGRLPPVRCTARLVLLWAQRLGKTATLVPSRWSFARRHMLDNDELVWTSVKRGHFGRLVTATPRCAHGRVNSDRAVDRSRCEAGQTSGTSSPHGSLACLSSQVSRRGVLLVSFSLLDSKRYGRSAPAP